MLTLLTATGCRPEAWAICERLMTRQTFAGPVRWIIVDDGEVPQPITFDRSGWTLEIIRPETKWRPGTNTQATNLAIGAKTVGGDARLLVIEDDDAYSHDYLVWANDALDRADLVGESFARYYNIATRQARQLSNSQHASLCSTAVKGAAIEEFRRQLKPGVKFIDLQLWRGFKGRKLLERGNRVVGIKGLPGRQGIGMGHTKDFTGQSDASGSILRQWTGHNADLYPSGKQ